MTDAELFKSISNEVNHYAEIMDISDLGGEAMKYCAAIAVRADIEIKKLESDEEKAIAGIIAMEPLNQIQEAMKSMAGACNALRAGFAILNEVKKGE